MAVIIALSQRVRRILVNDKCDVEMHLQSGRADGRSDRALNGFCDGSGFRTAGGKKQHAAGIENGTNAHGDGALRHLGFVGERMAIVFDRFAAERFQPGAGSEAGSLFVETDVAIATDAKNLQVDAAGSFDGLFVSLAIGVVIAGDVAVGNVDIFRSEIDIRKEILLHKKMEALRVRSRQSQIFVEIETGGSREI